AEMPREELALMDGLCRNQRRVREPVFVQPTVAPRSQRDLVCRPADTIAVRRDAKDRGLAEAFRKIGHDAGPRWRGRLVVDIGVHRSQRARDAREPRMDESHDANAALAPKRADGPNPVHERDARLTVVVHDDRDIYAEIPPRAREKHVLHGLSANVTERRIAGQHRIVFEPKYANLAYSHSAP